MFLQVSTNGAKDGLGGISISLFQAQEQEPILKTTTSTDGSFSLHPVQPGSYRVMATHPRWFLSKDSLQLTVKNDAITLQDSFKLAGYQVSGRVISDGEEMGDVSFVLLSSKKNPNISAIGCETKNLANFPIPKKDLFPICFTKSQSSGQFMFPAVPSGDYHIFSYYEGPGATKFDVQPSLFKFSVGKDSLHINTVFQVTGFSVEGKVLSKEAGAAIKNCIIQLNGKDAATTKDNGVFILESVNIGTYQLQVTDPSENYFFEPKEVKISPNSPFLPSIHPDKFRVCGKVTSSPDGERAQRFVIISAQSEILEELDVRSNTQKYCGFLSPGSYEVSVKLGEVERASGVQYSPLTQKISVTDSPISNIDFSQLKAVLQGSIKCLENKCPLIRILLTSNSVPSLQRTTIAEDGHYKFDDLIFGEYTVSVELNQFDWCWESPILALSVTSEIATAPTFVHTGMKITVIASHDIQGSYRKLGGKVPAKASVLSVKAGTSSFCLASSGDYEFAFSGCHGYESNIIEWKSGSGPLTIKAINHANKIQIISSDKTEDLYMNVNYIAENKIIKTTRPGPLKADTSVITGKFVYTLEVFLAPNEEIELVPESKLLIVTPFSLHVFGKDHCYPPIEPFHAEKGVILTGFITPPLSGVSVVFKDDDSNVINKLVTEADGRYQFGPIKAGLSYKITAEKEGYVISGPDNAGVFKARKLAEVAVTAIDKRTTAPLQGVLISLSGHENYRSNGQTDATGNISFLSLSPSEYYLRPIMKEYRFLPSSRMVSVSEGATAEIVFSGERVAFSVFGRLVALNGEPEEGISVQATGIGSPACTQLVEESLSEANGLFCIRGLQPQCEYSIGIANKSNENQHVSKTVPEKFLVKVKDNDVKGIQLTVLSPVTQTNIVAQISVNNPEHLRTLQARLYRDDRADKPTASVKLSNWKWSTYALNSGLITLPSVSMDGARYLFQLESSLSQNSHSYTLPSVSFIANDSFQLIKAVFNPEPRLSESEFNNKSFIVVLILASLAIAYYKQDVLMNCIIPLTAIRWTSREYKRVVNDENNSDVVIVEPVSIKRKLKPKKL
ncbi:BOS complex subunit NOMO1 isoform X3 [Bemisia tabaci]|uniref:BOS complex subunit NOMO1 isoform X3 n=1 Tax=Bemisia tabaci TaxID=7038 RepID=UPI003B285DCE